MNLVLRFSPKCEQGGEGVKKSGKSAYVLNGWSLMGFVNFGFPDFGFSWILGLWLLLSETDYSLTRH